MGPNFGLKGEPEAGGIYIARVPPSKHLSCIRQQSEFALAPIPVQFDQKWSSGGAPLDQES